MADGGGQRRKNRKPDTRPPWERRRTLLDAERALFLQVLSETGNITRASREVAQGAGVTGQTIRQSLYDLRDADPEFAKAWDEARERGIDRWEDEVTRRAFEGYERQLSFQGETTGDTVTEYSDSLAMFMLNGNRSAKYKHRVSSEHTGKDGGPIEVAELRSRFESAFIAALAGTTPPDRGESS